MAKSHGGKLAIGLVLLAVLPWLPISQAAGALIAYYTFDEGAGQTVVDQTGNYHGTLGASASVGSDDPTWLSGGMFGGGLSFDGGDYVNLGAAIIPTSGPFTVSGWGKTSATHNGAMIGQGNADPGRFIVYFTRSNAGDVARLYFDNNQAVGTTKTNDGQWHHVALTRSATNLFTLYVDGVSQATLSRAANVRTSENTFLGANTITDWRFNGVLDDMAMFDTALDAGDIKYIAAYGAGSDYLNRATWHNKSWDCRQEITISSAVTDTDLTGFPLLVKITDGSNPIFNRAAADGRDILFTDANGNKLNHEIESYSNGATKELNAWVNVDLSSASDTTIYMYYDNDSASDQQNVAGTWDASFQMVQHLNETSGTHFDSTSKVNHCTTIPSGVNQNVGGKIDGADDFNGTTSSGFQTPYGAGINPSEASQTYELWVKSDTLSPQKIFLSSGQGTNDRMYLGMDGGDWEMGIQNSGWGPGSTDATNEWTHLALVLDANTDLAKLYVNGVFDHQRSYSSYFFEQNIFIGRHDSATLYFFDGMIDEVRFSDTARAAEWILASYLTQRYGATDQFITFGEQVLVPEPGSAVLLGFGLLALSFVLRKRRFS